MREKVDARLHSIYGNSQDTLSQAIYYALFTPAKRLRPLLVIASAQTFGLNPIQAIEPACSIELVHTFSLIHDDLPCMDDDDVRRGEKSLHRVFPESIALLAGDALLSDAFLLLAEMQCQDAMKVKLCSLLSRRIGRNGMTGGQALDMLLDKNANLSDRLVMQQKKTGDLISCALEFGPILAGVEEHWQNKMRSIGLALGDVYQMLDDIEDGEQASDLKKNTLTLSLKEKELKALIRRRTDELKEALIQLPFNGSFLSFELNPFFEKIEKHAFLPTH